MPSIIFEIVKENAVASVRENKDRTVRCGVIPVAISSAANPGAVTHVQRNAPVRPS